MTRALARPPGPRHDAERVGFTEIAFPYRAHRPFGLASFALVFVALIAEIELLVALALGLVARRIDLFLELQPALFPAAVLVALVAAAVFAFRARSWTKARIALVSEWSSGAGSYAERLAKSRAR